jgi:hypothetical protein
MGYSPNEITIKINGTEINLQEACDKLLKSKIIDLDIIKENTTKEEHKKKIENLVNIIKEK